MQNSWRSKELHKFCPPNRSDDLCLLFCIKYKSCLVCCYPSYWCVQDLAEQSEISENLTGGELDPASLYYGVGGDWLGYPGNTILHSSIFNWFRDLFSSLEAHLAAVAATRVRIPASYKILYIKWKPGIGERTLLTLGTKRVRLRVLRNILTDFDPIFSKLHKK